VAAAWVVATVRYSTSSHRHAGHVATPNRRDGNRDNPGEDVVEIFRLVEMSGDLSEGHCQLRRGRGYLPSLGSVVSGDCSPIPVNAALESLVACHVTSDGGLDALGCGAFTLVPRPRRR
jgi:hypothetical protein